MIPASIALKTHLTSEVTTLTLCWKVTRKDGVTSGFTSFSRDLAVDGITRVAGNMIWSTDITATSENVLVGTTVIEGGKSGRTQPVYQTREFYVASFAVSMAVTSMWKSTSAAKIKPPMT